MAEYYEYNSNLSQKIPSPKNSSTGRPKAWVFTGGYVNPSSNGVYLYPGAKLRRYVNVDGGSGLKIQGIANGPCKITLGGVVVFNDYTSSTTATKPIPDGLAGDVILEIEALPGPNPANSYYTYPQLNGVLKTAPFVDAYAENAVSFPGVAVAFFDSSATANSTWLWDFGDGTTSTEKNPTHTYTELGEYTAILTTNLGTKKVLVLITDPAPIVAPTSNITAGPAPLSVKFRIGRTYNFDHGMTTGNANAVWDFGDGSPVRISSDPSEFTKQFTAPGTYNVTLTVTGWTGITAQAVIPIAVRALVPPVVDFSSSPKGGLTVGFKDLSANNPTGWTWDFGENDKIVKNPVHTYQAPGTYNVKLTATNADGSGNKTISIPVTVTAAPVPKADFTHSIPSSTAPLTVQFTDQTSGDPTAWLWNFGDGTISTEQSPLKSYQALGVYTVFLTATVDGNQYSTQKTITVQAGTVTPPPSDTCTPATVAVNTRATITLKGSGFKANSKIRIMKDVFRGIATVKSISSTQIVFEFFFSDEYLGVCGVMVIPTTGTSKVFENVITVS